MAKTRSLQKLYEAYKKSAPRGQRFCDALKTYLSDALQREGVELASPIAARVKKCSSIAAKYGRGAVQQNKLERLRDFIGLRLVVLFPSEMPKVWRLIEDIFVVKEQIDCGKKLVSATGETGFGYQSVHFEVELPPNLLSLPQFQDCFGLRAEIQVRSLSQHLWASASHSLQYKDEKSIPKPIRRSLTRLAAILETVDFELERILREQAEYRSMLDSEPDSAPLNEDNVDAILRHKLPKGVWIEDYHFSTLVEDLAFFKICTRGGLMDLLDYYAKNLPVVDDEPKDYTVQSDDPWDWTEGDYSPAGIIHGMLIDEDKVLYDIMQYERAARVFADFAPDAAPDVPENGE